MTSLTHTRLNIEILVEGLPKNHSVACDLSKWNVQIKGVKTPLPFEFLGTWIFQDDVIIKEVVEFGGFCGGICWAIHENYPSLLASNFSPAPRSIRFELNVKRADVDAILKSIDDDTMANCLQDSLSEIPKKFSKSLGVFYSPIKILQVRRNERRPSLDQSGLLQQKLKKEADYWKVETSNHVKEIISLQIERDRSKSRCQQLQKNLRDAEERNMKLIRTQTNNADSDEMKALKDQIAEERYKRKQVESENKILKKSTEENTLVAQENDTIIGLKKQIQILTEVNSELKFEMELQSLNTENQEPVVKSDSEDENLRNLLNEQENKNKEMVGKLQQKEETIEDLVNQLEMKEKFLKSAKTELGMFIDKDNAMTKEAKSLKQKLQDKDDEIQKWRQQADDLDERYKELDETCEILKESLIIGGMNIETSSEENANDSISEGIDEEISDADFENQLQEANREIKSVKILLSEKDDTIENLKIEMKNAEEKALQAKRDLEKIHENQKKTEAVMESREQSYRANIVRLNKEIFRLEAELAAHV